MNESEEGAEALVECLLSHQATSLLLHNLQRLDENVREEADGVHNTLGIYNRILQSVFLTLSNSRKSYSNEEIRLTRTVVHSIFTVLFAK